MKTLVDHLAQYAAYHRDRRNIATHFFGIPMIVVAVLTYFSRPHWEWHRVHLSPAWAVLAATLGLFYFRLDVWYGLAMTVALGAAAWLGHTVAAQSTTVWLTTATSLFVVGWVIQLVGHVFEGRKPAFVDDLIGLLVGPLFIVAEIGFALGLRREVRRDFEAIAGPTRFGHVPQTT